MVLPWPKKSSNFTRTRLSSSSETFLFLLVTLANYAAEQNDGLNLHSHLAPGHDTSFIQMGHVLVGKRFQDTENNRLVPGDDVSRLMSRRLRVSQERSQRPPIESSALHTSKQRPRDEGVSYPAAIRSSRTELFKDWRHQWPAADCSRSKRSGSGKCATSLRIAIMATTRDLREPRKLGSLIMRVNAATAVDFAALSRHSGACCRCSVAEQKEQRNVFGLETPSLTSAKVLSAAQGI